MTQMREGIFPHGAPFDTVFHSVKQAPPCWPAVRGQEISTASGVAGEGAERHSLPTSRRLKNSVPRRDVSNESGASCASRGHVFADVKNSSFPPGGRHSFSRTAVAWKMSIYSYTYQTCSIRTRNVPARAATSRKEGPSRQARQMSDHLTKNTARGGKCA